MEQVKVIYHSAKFGDHRHSGIRDIKFFVCHVTLQDPVINVLCDFMVRSPSSHPLPSFVVVGTVVVEI